MLLYNIGEGSGAQVAPVTRFRKGQLRNTWQYSYWIDAADH